jgi:EAL domain-containing protein (putative c-di-GMP-specific phosphodiesterase class I)
MAKVLNLRPVAEGVERAEQLERLLQLGCDTAQGYYFARPGSQADVESQISGAPASDALAKAPLVGAA